MSLFAILAAIADAVLRGIQVLDKGLDWLAKKALLSLPVLVLAFFVIFLWVIHLVKAFVVETLSSVPLSDFAYSELLAVYAFINFALPLYEFFQVVQYMISVFCAFALVKAIKRWIPGLGD